MNCVDIDSQLLSDDDKKKFVHFIPFKWEKIDEKKEDNVFWFATYRAKVIGGWLVRNFDLTNYVDSKEHVQDLRLSTSESMVFIPDQHHLWMV